jgi:formylglycine-generating enzyme required for sulfatase activity
MGYPGSGTSPVRDISLTGFYMGRYQVTQALYQEIMGYNPSQFRAGLDTRPVEIVSWFNAVQFSNRLSIRDGLTPAYTISGNEVTVDWYATGYRLPTEAEWEYAARGGRGTPGDFVFAGSNHADDVAWFNTNSNNMTHPVGTKAPNGLGIYDMNGNVAEWCWDWYGPYTGNDLRNPRGPVVSSLNPPERVRRGGSWNNAVNSVRNVSRSSAVPTTVNSVIGFRLVRAASPLEVY